MLVDREIVQVEGNLQGEKVAMGIDQDALAHIMSVLTDLYSDPEMAVIREYSTNAFDAHVEAGHTRPIEVSLPTNLSPFFRVRDYGVGLDIEDIKNIYSRYGSSTKRDTNDQVGMLGLGCKSALTYTSQFTLVGIKNGIRTDVSVSREQDGSGSMVVLAQEPSDEPSGVEVIVPVARYNQFEQKSSFFYSLWDEGTVLVNGEAPKRIEGIKVDEDVMLVRNIDDSYIVMGNVPYPINDHTFRVGHYHVVAFVNIGDVNFTPSREALQMTTKTKECLAVLREIISEERITVALTKAIDAAPTYAEALRMAIQFRANGIRTKIEYKGVKIPDEIFNDNGVKSIGRYGDRIFEDGIVTNMAWANLKARGGRGYNAEKKFENIRKAPLNLDGVIIFQNYDGKNFTPTRFEKLGQWASENAPTTTKFLMWYGKADLQWFDGVTVAEWADVDAQVLPKNSATTGVKANGRPRGTYTASVNGNGRYTQAILAENIDTSEPLFYLNYQDDRSMAGLIQSVYPTATVVFVEGNRIEKFKRDFPMARKLSSIREEGSKFVSSLAVSTRKALALQQNDYLAKSFKALNGYEILDPEVNEYIKLANRNLRDLQVKLNKYARFGGALNLDVNLDNPLSKYMLLDTDRYSATINKQNVKHAVIYMNAVYSAKEGQ